MSRVESRTSALSTTCRRTRIFLGLLLLLGQKKFVERAVHAGKLAQLLGGYQVYRVERRVQRLQPAQIAVIVRKILQKARRHLGALRAPATRDLGHRRIQAGRRKLAVLLNHALHAVAFGTRDQRILQLLRIDSRGVLAEQRHGVVGSDHALHHLLVFEQAHPLGEALLLRRAFRRGFVGRSCAHQRAGILWSAQPGIDGFAGGFFAVERADETPHHILQARIAVGIAIPVAQHDVMLGAKVVVAAILGKRQAVDE